ncbi:MAG: IS1595 family transposase [bacterium]|nr:IS1595 family transposase [bacterium]
MCGAFFSRNSIVTTEPKLSNLLDLHHRFPTEQSCFDYIEEKRWGRKPQCPRCTSEKAAKFTTGKYAGKLWYCNGCKKQFTVKIGTVFEDSAIPLLKWFHAIWICTAHKKGIASTQLAKDIGVTQKTAWHMLGRIRLMMSHGSMEKTLSGTIEVDETYVGGKESNKHKDKKTPNTQGRSTKTKTAVFGMKERGGDVICYPVDSVNKETLQGGINERVVQGSTVNTDEWASYIGLSDNYTHETVDHGAKEYTRGFAHTNNIEDFWSLLKRGIIGVYHSVSPVHLHRYCGEFAYRSNTRSVTDAERFGMVMGQANGKLTYKELTG